MITKYLYILLISILSLIMLSSCFSERIDLDLNTLENKKVVITSWLNNLDDDQYVQVYYTGDYFIDPNMESINDATVTLSYETEELVLENTTNGIYLLPSEWKGVEDIEYTLTVTHNNMEYRAVSILRAMPLIQNIESVLQIENDTTSFYEIYFEFQETAGEGDGYFAIDYIKNSNQKNVIKTGDWIDDSYLDGEYITDLTVTSNNHQQGDTVILETHNIGLKAVEYLESIDTEIFREGLLDPPPVNVPTNFSNGAVGYFLTSGKRINEIIID